MAVAELVEAWTSGWALTGPEEISDDARAVMHAALLHFAAVEDDPATPPFIAKIGAYEGLLATLEHRRHRLSKRWERRIRPVTKAIAVGLHAERVIRTARPEVEAVPPHPDGKPDKVLGTRVAKGVALIALRRFLHEDEELAKELTAIVSLAEAEAAAEGVVQAEAMVALVRHEDIPDLDDLYRRTLDALRNLDGYGADANSWIQRQLEGLAGDMGRAIADGIEANLGRADLLAAVNAVIDKGEGAALYLDETIHYAMQQAAVSQMVANGVGLLDYVAQPGACGACSPLDSSVAGPYQPEAAPAPPMHIHCRCLLLPAGTVT